MLILPDGTLFFLSSEVGDSGKYHCVVFGDNHEDVEISDDAVVTVLSDEDYYDYHDEHSVETDFDEKAVDDRTESVTNTVDAIKEETKIDDGRIVMEIEATAIGKEADDVTKTDIPLVFWVICLSVVSFMTLLVIFGAGFIIFKIKNMKNHNVDIEIGANIYERPVQTKRMSWIETPWNFYPSSTQLKTFRNQNLLNTSENNSNNSSDYDYASSDYFLLSKSSNETTSPSHQNIFKSNHYASSNIQK